VQQSNKNHKFKIYDERDFEMHLNHKFKWSSIVNNSQDATSFIKFLEFIGVNWLSNDCHFKCIDNNTIGVLQNNRDHQRSNKTSEDSDDTVLQNHGSFDYPQVTIHADPNNNEATLKADGYIYYTFKLMKENSENYLYAYEISLEGAIASYRNLSINASTIYPSSSKPILKTDVLSGSLSTSIILFVVGILLILLAIIIYS
jgi:hypothetical protein